ncbi:MAG: GNAT family N-acetyltransferase [Bdellovibrionaceae bacterium]|nr:GNAT family N-acetyltransferase [Pseudobdellovibrionaceae bacterium]
MLKPRPPQQNELPEVINFLDSNMRKDQSWSVREEYPLAFDQQNSHNIRIIRSEEQILSHAVLKPLIMKTPYSVFNVCMMGSVLTDPTLRNQGLAAQVIEDCIDQATLMKSDILVLWTDLFDFYKKFGFELAGTEISLIINNSFNPKKRRNDLKIVENNKVDPQALLRLYNLHSITTHRTPNDIKKYLQIPNSRVYTAWNKNGQMEAYAIEGKGVDLQGYVHEWGGNTSALIELFCYIQKQQNREIMVISPPQCKNLIRQCQEGGALPFEGILGMIKIIDKAELARKAQRAARRMGITDFAIEMHNDTLYFGTSEEVFKTDSEADMVHLFFGPQRPSEMYPFSEETQVKLNKLLPLPCWIWGWDSI